jgi:hypothetical protein
MEQLAFLFRTACLLNIQFKFSMRDQKEILHKDPCTLRWDKKLCQKWFTPDSKNIFDQLLQVGDVCSMDLLHTHSFLSRFFHKVLYAPKFNVMCINGQNNYHLSILDTRVSFKLVYKHYFRFRPFYDFYI